jgi:hypothetical protein
VADVTNLFCASFDSAALDLERFSIIPGISARAEVVCAFVGLKDIDESADQVPEAADGLT